MTSTTHAGSLHYENIRTFDEHDGTMRIFAPASYPLVRHSQIVPIVHIEALSMADWFPVCWQIKNRTATLVVLRTLRRDGTQQPMGSPQAMTSLPLALRAYPFVVGRDKLSGDAHLIDSAIPDEPSDIGAPILTAGSKAGAGTRMKLQAKAAFDHALPLTRAMTDDLLNRELLEPWPLAFEIEGETLAVNDLQLVKPVAFSSLGVFHFVEVFGPAGAALLGAHRVSLFRAGSLVQSARQAAAARLAHQQHAFSNQP